MLEKIRSSISFVMIVFLFVFSFLPSLAHAQGAEIVKSSTIPLTLNIEDTKYLSESRTLVIDYSVTNNSDSFIDSLKYNFSFYQGDQLEKEGLLFRNLDYVFSISDEFGNLSPKETKRNTIQYVPPVSIDGGNYFIKGTVFNEQFSFYGATHTKDPIKLTGRGGFISKVLVELLDLETGNTYKALEGPTLDKEKSYAITFSESSNKELFKLFEKGNAYADLKIANVNDSENIVYKIEGISLKDAINSEGKSIEIKIEPWKNIKSGPHTAYLDITNAKGDSIAENISVRLLYGGLFGRIYKTDTKINSYRLGEPIDLVANITVAGDVNAEKVNLKAIFKNEKGTEQEFQKEVLLNKSLSGIDTLVDFKDEESKKMLVDEIELILSDTEGNILDSQIIKMNTDDKFSYPLGAKQITNIIVTVISLIVLLIVIAFILKKTKLLKSLLVFLIIFIGSTALYQDQIIAFAQGGTEIEGDYADVWSVPDGEPSGLQENVCGTACIDTEFYVKLQCKTCSNQALSLDINYFNNWQSGDTLADGEYDRSGIANDEYLSDILSGDTIDQFIYGPFNFPFCFENFDDEGNMLELEDYTGTYSQAYNVQVKTTFGGDYCQLDVVEGEQGSSSSAFTGVSNEIRTMSCKVPGTLKTSFFIDYDEDGVKTSDEPYLKSKVANVQCAGIVSGILGRVFSSAENVDFRSLRPKNCDDDFKSYFSKNRLSPGNYVPSIEPSNTFGWEQTGLQYFNNSTWQTVSEVPVVSRGVSYANIGVKNTDEVVISCSVDTGNNNGGTDTDPDDGTGVITDPDDENPDEDDDDDPPLPPGQGGAGGSFSNDGTDPDDNDDEKDYCPGLPQDNYIQPYVQIFNVANDLPVAPACFTNELTPPACGLSGPKNYHMIGFSLRLYDPCHPSELWFIKSYFQNSLVGNDVRRHGDEWDVTVDKNYSISEFQTHKIKADGWTVNSRIDNGKTRLIFDDENITIQVCECAQCNNPRAINGPGNGN